MTKNDDLWRRCKEFSDSFVHDDLSEDLDRPRAAGCILYAQDTGRYGLQQRSDTVNDPGVWAAWGGGRELGETLEQCATRELAEESGYTGPLKLKRLAENNKYTTFIGVVPHEFEPRACSEWKDYCWVDAGDWPGPMHPGVTEALKNIPANKQQVAESFDQPYPMTWEHGDESHDALVRLPDGTNLSIMFSKDYGAYGDEEWTVEFWRNNSQEATGEGDQQRVFATVLSAIQQFIGTEHPERIRFSANKDVESGQKSQTRSNLYTKLVQRYANSWGYGVDVDDFADTTVYNLHTLTENFADGRNPQDKGDAKRHGVPTKASVSTLRKVAKQGGRKGQLAHWMANMKAGRAKARKK
jgi:8-oxo-dGTP pyrophosphatase MutT (NUDIX family)